MSPCSNHCIAFQFITQDAKDQNRESQRRSRARRAEVMNSLKKQVEAYQQQGAAASLEMQKVAQAVAFENQRLRDLLRKHGVSQDDIERYITMPSTPSSLPQARLYEPSSPRCRSCGSTSITAEKLLVSTSMIKSCTSPNISQQEFTHPPPATSLSSKPIETTSADRKIALEVDPTAIALPPQSIASHESENKCSQKNSDNRDQNQHRISYTGKDKDKIHDGETLEIETPLSMPLRDPHYTPKKEDRAQAMETSCDTAASILVDLHHHADTERARAALGCKGPNSCTVNNIKIFQLLENFS
jgi:hypothetical protein